MLGIFDDDRRLTGPISPNAVGAGSILPPAASRMAWGTATPQRHPLLAGDKIVSRRDHNVSAHRPSATGFAPSTRTVR